MKQDHNVNYSQDWKMVTIMAGGFDACSYVCDGFGWPWRALRPVDASPPSFTRNIRRTLDILQRYMPKTFVNLVPTPGNMILSIFTFIFSIWCALFPDLTVTLRILELPLACRKFLQFVCPCLFDDKKHERMSGTQLREILTLYLRGMEKLLAGGRYDKRNDFTVVLQPFLTQLNLPTSSPRPGARPQPDLSYFAPDCFHFSQKLHAAGRQTSI